jgi:nickel transport protein
VKAALHSLFGLALAGFATTALAHTVWLEPTKDDSGDYRVVFGGHAGKVEPYQADKLKAVDALDASGKQLNVKRSVDADGVRLHVDGALSIIAMHFDNGIHTRTEGGPSVEKPMNEVPGATRATNAVKYHKTIVGWSGFVTKSLGQPFEVVPLDSVQPTAGRPLRVQVFQDGKPLPGVKLGRGEEGTAADPVTDANGIATFVPAAGFNKLWAGRRIPVTGNPKYSELSYEYLLGFNAE